MGTCHASGINTGTIREVVPIEQSGISVAHNTPRSCNVSREYSNSTQKYIIPLGSDLDFTSYSALFSLNAWSAAGLVLVISDLMGNTQMISAVPTGSKLVFLYNLLRTNGNIQHIGIEHEPTTVSLASFFKGVARDVSQTYSISIPSASGFICNEITSSYPTYFGLTCVQYDTVVFSIFKWTQSDRQTQQLLSHYINRDNHILQLLLTDIYPSHVLPTVLAGNFDTVWTHTNIIVGFFDIVGYTTKSAIDNGVFTILNGFYSEVLKIARVHSMTIVEIEGDAIIITRGLGTDTPSGSVCEWFVFIYSIIECAISCNIPVRCGLAKGRAKSGVIRAGQCRYRLFGDVVNVASRLQSHAKESSLLITDILYKQAIVDKYIHTQFTFKLRPRVDIKGRGVMDVYEVTRLNVHTSRSKISRLRPRSVSGSGFEPVARPLATAGTMTVKHRI
jgi:class 3 adenylate cyclase